MRATTHTFRAPSAPTPSPCGRYELLVRRAVNTQAAAGKALKKASAALHTFYACLHSHLVSTPAKASGGLPPELHSLEGFVEWVHTFARQFSQAERVRRACGAPCLADHVLP